MAPLDLGDRHLELLRAVIQVSSVNVTDWNKVAEIANMKTGKYARDQWAIVRTKLGAAASKDRKAANGGNEADGDSDGETATPNGKGKTKATPRKRKTDADDEESPTKKTPASKKKKAKASEDEEVTVKDEPNEAGEMMDDLAG